MTLDNGVLKGVECHCDHQPTSTQVVMGRPYGKVQLIQFVVHQDPQRLCMMQVVMKGSNNNTKTAIIIITKLIILREIITQ